MSSQIPFDEWVKIPNEELAKKGLCEVVYRPSNYKGPIAIDGFIKKTCCDAPGARIWLSKDEAKIMLPDKQNDD